MALGRQPPYHAVCQSPTTPETPAAITNILVPTRPSPRSKLHPVFTILALPTTHHRHSDLHPPWSPSNSSPPPPPCLLHPTLPPFWPSRFNHDFLHFSSPYLQPSTTLAPTLRHSGLHTSFWLSPTSTQKHNHNSTLVPTHHLTGPTYFHPWLHKLPQQSPRRQTPPPPPWCTSPAIIFIHLLPPQAPTYRHPVSHLSPFWPHLTSS